MDIHQWPTVSVITVSFNDLAGLKATRASVQDHDYPGHLEHIIVDGGSGQEVENFLATSGVLRWVSEPDDGIYPAMNKGIQMACGDILWFMNSADTFAAPSAIRCAVAMLTDPPRQWGYGKVHWLHPNGSLHSVQGREKYRRGRHLLGRDMVPHQGAFFGRRIVEQVGGYRSDHPVAADQDFILSCAAITPPVVCHSTLALFDTQGISGSLTRRQHYTNMRNLRESRRETITGSRYLDRLLDTATVAGEVAVRVAKGALRRVRNYQESTQ